MSILGLARTEPIEDLRYNGMVWWSLWMKIVENAELQTLQNPIFQVAVFKKPVFEFNINKYNLHAIWIKNDQF